MHPSKICIGLLQARGLRPYDELGEGCDGKLVLEELRDSFCAFESTEFPGQCEHVTPECVLNEQSCSSGGIASFDKLSKDMKP